MRDVDGWWKSYAGTIMKMMAEGEKRPPGDRSELGKVSRRIIGDQTFGGDYTDEAAARAAFQQRIDDVTAAIPAERLLVFNVRDGWEPLSRFLNVPVPHTAFPRSNSTAEFWENFG